MLNKGTNIVGSITPYSTIIPYVKIGEEGDATSLENFRKAVDFVELGNSYRAKENLRPLKISSAMMAMSEVNADYQHVSWGHTRTFNALENLASKSASYSGYTYDPYDGWYTKEKAKYDSGSTSGVGHYLTLTDRQGKMYLTGFGVGDWYDSGWYNRYFSQHFSDAGSRYNLYYMTSAGDTTQGITVAKYREYLNAYQCAVLGHTWDNGKVTKQPTCLATGTKLFTCTVCGKTKTETIPKLQHTPGTPVKENEVAPTCAKEGSYDSVVYCTACHTELSREKITVAKLQHNPGTPVKENEVAPTCTKEGSYDSVVYCTACHNELSREKKTVAKLQHNPGQPVIENDVPATPTTNRQYDEVVYCTACNTELSREHIVVLKDIPKVEEKIEVHKVYTPNVKLESVGVTADTSVPGSWEWVQPNTPVVCPGGTYACRFVPDDLINYECVVRDIKVVVDKAKPYIYDLDTTRITYGQTIGDSEIIAEVHHSIDNDTVVTGTFAWENPDIAPVVSDSTSKTYEIMFTPDDTDNYTSLTTRARVFVDKAEIPGGAPSEFSVPFSVDKVTDDILAEYDKWKFEKEYIGESLTPEVTLTVNAEYTGEDKDNYERTSVPVKITRSKCDHDGDTEVRDAYDPTCTEPGYTGDVYCLKCGDVKDRGTAIPATGHKMDGGKVTKEATCVSEGVRTFTCVNGCGLVENEPIQKDPDNHPEGKIKIEAMTPASVTQLAEADEHGNRFSSTAGTTAKKWCDACHAVLSDAVEIPAVSGISIDAGNPVADGTAKKAKIAVVAAPSGNETAEIRLTEGKDYAVSYADNTKAGTATVTITFKGDYTGTYEDSFVIKEPEQGSGSGNNQPGSNTPETQNPASDTAAPAGGQVAPGAKAAAVQKYLTTRKSDADPAGSEFGKLKLRIKKNKKTSQTLKWSKVPKAVRYDVYANKCGKANSLKKVASVKGTTYKAKKLKKGTYYKYVVIAVGSNGRVVSSSKVVHMATSGGKVGNDKAVKTKAKKNKVTVKKGKTFKLKGKAVRASKKLKVKKHVGIRYESSNPKVATVSKTGVIKGLMKGKTCYVYVYAQDGVYKRIKVNVS